VSFVRDRARITLQALEVQVSGLGDPAPLQSGCRKMSLEILSVNKKPFISGKRATYLVGTESSLDQRFKR
jgi:hypothetical protein